MPSAHGDMVTLCSPRFATTFLTFSQLEGANVDDLERKESAK